MTDQWVSFLGLLLELLRKRSSFSIDIARLEEWSQEFVASWNQEENPVWGDGNTEGKEKPRQEMDSVIFEPLYPAELEDQLTPRPFSYLSQYLPFFI